ncbi:MAG: transglycosylase domain-containing protein [Akkermansia sp.]|nr:transglycosylase domain-containing protein [Akkermansia sp.]
MENLDEYQNTRKAAADRRRKRRAAKEKAVIHRSPGCWWKRAFVRVSIVISVALITLSLIGYALFVSVTAKYQKWAEEFNLEDINNLDHPCIIYDRNGEEIGRIYDENRSYVPYNEISRSMVDALVAQEDKNFWEHNGFDPVGIIRAIKEAMAAGGQANQGASTITQQLARNAYDLEQRTAARGGSRYERKVVEIFLAMRIEKKYDKQQILEFYINRVYFGRGFYGIRAASLGYFGKEPADLTVREAASIAALIKNPENYNPLRNPQLNWKWRNDVIDRMERAGMLTAGEAARQKETELGLNPRPIKRNTSFLHALVQQQAIGIFQNPERGEEIVKSRGIKIYTTIDRRMQEAAENSLRAQLEKIEAREDYAHVRFNETKDPRCAQHRYVDGAVFAVDNATGGVLVYVGGRSFERDNFDIIESGRRSVGTAMLPFLYMCAFDNGYTPSSRLLDDALDNRLAGIGGSEGILGEWGMEVEKGRYLDSITLRQSLEWSKIAASARLGIALGSDATKGARCFQDTLSSVGITPPPRNPNSTELKPQYYPRVYLGTEPVSLKEVTMAYTVFPNVGKRPIAPYVVTRITDSNGNILWENPLFVTHHMVRSTSPCTAYRLHSIMRESMERGSAQRVRPLLPEHFSGAVKTGTNYDFSDNALFGYTSSFTCGIWMGYLNDHQPIYPQAFGSDTCAPVYAAVVTAAKDRFADVDIATPPDTEEVEICLSSGQIATNFCFETVIKDGKPGYVRPTYREYIPKGDVTLGQCSIHGDGSPSLVDFMETHPGHMNSSRVLAVVPVLPQSSALIGEDPYDCDLVLNPRYKDATELSDVASSAEEVSAADDDSPEEVNGPVIDTELQINAPSTLQHLPLVPLQL